MVDKLQKNREWFARSKRVIPGCSQTFSKGYTQYVQGVAPFCLERGEGARAWDVDGNVYIDYVQGLLTNILGYAHPEVNAAAIEQIHKGISFSLPHPVEVELAEVLAERIPCAEMVRFAKNGTDVTSAAIRAARAYTQREVIACCGYHGWQDWYIGSTTRSLGVPWSTQALTRTFEYNNLDSLKQIMTEEKVAAVILEPTNFTAPAPGFLEELLDLCQSHGALLIFDEICTGFRMHRGGAQAYFGVTPDLACIGKGMANGFPLSAIVGKAEIMEIFEDIFFSGTFGGEAVSLAASLKTLEVLDREQGVEKIWQRGQMLTEGIQQLLESFQLHSAIQIKGYPFWSLMQFSDTEKASSIQVKSYFQQECLKEGLLTIGTHNLTLAHDEEIIAETLTIYKMVFQRIVEALSKGHFAMEGTLIEPVFKVRA